MQNSIIVDTEPFNKDGISMLWLTRFPVVGLLGRYWDGSSEEMSEFLLQNGVLNSASIDLRSVEDTLDFSNVIFEKLAKLKSKIGSFDFRLASLFKAKFLKEFRLNEFETITFDISSFENTKAKEEIKRAFMSSSTQSFIDFRNIMDDKMYLSIARRGIAEEYGRLSIVTAREQITLLNNFKQAKDNNFICSDFILKMATEMTKCGLGEATFTHIFKAANSFEKTYTANHIVEVAAMSAEQKEDLKRAEEIKKIAKEEVKAEQSLTRTSLMPDSNEAQIMSAKTQVRISPEVLSGLGDDGVDDDFAIKLYDEFSAKEVEKQRIRLQKAKDDGIKAYETIKGYLANGFAVLEALQKTKEQFRQEETVIFASYMLTKDLLNLVHKDNQIYRLSSDNEGLNAQIEKLSEELVKKEHSIKEHQAATTKKSNELNLLKEEFESQINEMSRAANEKIGELKNEFENKINEANSIIDDQARAIDRLLPFEQTAKNSDKKLENIEERYEQELSKAQNRFEALQDKYDEMIGAKQELEYKNMMLNSNLANINSTHEALKNELNDTKRALMTTEAARANASDAEFKNRYLEQKVADLEAQIKSKDELIYTLLRPNEVKQKGEVQKILEGSGNGDSDNGAKNKAK